MPFTAALGDDGLLAGGIDPPASEQIPDWPGGESWRAWVIHRLARAILRARALPQVEAEPWLIALDRLRLEGVDVEAWLPSESIWTSGGTP